jgi:hypothetical protein
MFFQLVSGAAGMDCPGFRRFLQQTFLVARIDLFADRLELPANLGKICGKRQPESACHQYTPV